MTGKAQETATVITTRGSNQAHMVSTMCERMTWSAAQALRYHQLHSVMHWFEDNV